MRGGYPAPWSHGGPLSRNLREMNKINVSLETVVENRFRKHTCQAQAGGPPCARGSGNGVLSIRGSEPLRLPAALCSDCSCWPSWFNALRLYGRFRGPY